VKNSTEWVALVSSLLTIFLACLNVIQRLENLSLKKALRERLKTAFNNYRQIAEWSDKIREPRPGITPDEHLRRAINLA
jgi:ABC-type nickel/cobalt efflux system permease component RcnA